MTLSTKNKTLATLLMLASCACLSSQTVYVNSHGSKYHHENCVQLGRNRSAIALTEAQVKGYKYCSSCTAIKKDELEDREKQKEVENKNHTARAEEKTDN